MYQTRGANHNQRDMIETNILKTEPLLHQFNYHTFTAFNTPKETIVREIFATGQISLPSTPKFQPNYVDRRKFCEYHRIFGHTIKECVGLKYLLESLARSGRLERYIEIGNQGQYQQLPHPIQQIPEEQSLRQPRSELESSEPHNENPPVQGVINTIAGGFTGGGQTKSTRRKHLRAIQLAQSTN